MFNLIGKKALVTGARAADFETLVVGDVIL
jgi:hypothetical protein